MQTILIVDSDEGLVQALSMVFAAHGFQTCVADTDWQAAELVAQEKPDIILITDDRPHINVRRFCMTMKTDPMLAHIPIMMQSRSLRAQNPAYALAVGADAVLPKYFNSAVLVSTVESMLMQARA